ncbi:hypothetical protein BC828DRAFT_416985 [Blastocladiella britannica]|nr:hypothetical protein BC828DRAFT_416985 [Blastocladiella britannica]
MTTETESSPAARRRSGRIASSAASTPATAVHHDGHDSDDENDRSTKQRRVAAKDRSSYLSSPEQSDHDENDDDHGGSDDEDHQEPAAPKTPSRRGRGGARSGSARGRGKGRSTAAATKKAAEETNEDAFKDAFKVPRKPAAAAKSGRGTRKSTAATTGGRARGRVVALDLDQLYETVTTPKVAMSAVVAMWLNEYHLRAAEALRAVVNMIIEATGCTEIVSEARFEDLNGIADYVEELQSHHASATSYPLVARDRATKAAMAQFLGFFTTLVHTDDDALYDGSLLDLLISWLASLASSPLRPFRHTATAAALTMATALCGALARGDAHAHAAKVRDLHAAIYDGLFVHRYRDTDPTIRAECLRALQAWIADAPDVFLDPAYLRYCGWMLNDPHPAVRTQALGTLGALYADPALVPGLRLFTERFKGRVLQMAAADVDPGVQVAATTLAAAGIYPMAVYEPDDIDALCAIGFRGVLYSSTASASSSTLATGADAEARRALLAVVREETELFDWPQLAQWALRMARIAYPTDAGHATTATELAAAMDRFVADFPVPQLDAVAAAITYLRQSHLSSASAGGTDSQAVNDEDDDAMDVISQQHQQHQMTCSPTEHAVLALLAGVARSRPTAVAQAAAIDLPVLANRYKPEAAALAALFRTATRLGDAWVDGAPAARVAALEQLLDAAVDAVARLGNSSGLALEVARFVTAMRRSEVAAVYAEPRVERLLTAAIVGSADAALAVLKRVDVFEHVQQQQEEEVPVAEKRGGGASGDNQEKAGAAADMDDDEGVVPATPPKNPSTPDINDGPTAAAAAATELAHQVARIALDTVDPATLLDAYADVPTQLHLTDNLPSTRLELWTLVTIGIRQQPDPDLVAACMAVLDLPAPTPDEDADADEEDDTDRTARRTEACRKTHELNRLHAAAMLAEHFATLGTGGRVAGDQIMASVEAMCMAVLQSALAAPPTTPTDDGEQQPEESNALAEIKIVSQLMRLLRGRAIDPVYAAVVLPYYKRAVGHPSLSQFVADNCDLLLHSTLRNLDAANLVDVTLTSLQRSYRIDVPPPAADDDAAVASVEVSTGHGEKLVFLARALAAVFKKTVKVRAAPVVDSGAQWVVDRFEIPPPPPALTQAAHRRQHPSSSDVAGDEEEPVPEGVLTGDVDPDADAAAADAPSAADPVVDLDYAARVAAALHASLPMVRALREFVPTLTVTDARVVYAKYRGSVVLEPLLAALAKKANVKHDAATAGAPAGGVAADVAAAMMAAAAAAAAEKKSKAKKPAAARKRTATTPRKPRATGAAKPQAAATGAARKKAARAAARPRKAVVRVVGLSSDGEDDDDEDDGSDSAPPSPPPPPRASTRPVRAASQSQQRQMKRSFADQAGSSDDDDDDDHHEGEDEEVVRDAPARKRARASAPPPPPPPPPPPSSAKAGARSRFDTIASQSQETWIGGTAGESKDLGESSTHDDDDMDVDELDDGGEFAVPEGSLAGPYLAEESF